MTSESETCSAFLRLRQDYIKLKQDPVPYVVAEPLPSNILEWHYVIAGPEETPYEGGYYHGKLVFPREYPFKPPSIYMITPNGRFETNKRLCLSISDYHPESWNPAWNVGSILTGLLSFLTENTKTTGSIKTSTQLRKELAARSLKYNIENKLFRELFPELCKLISKTVEEKDRKNEETEKHDANLSDSSLSQ